MKKSSGNPLALFQTGSNVLQPARIVHREVRHSGDMELLGITSPAKFATQSESAPK